MSNLQRLREVGLTEVEIRTLAEWACPPHKSQAQMAREQGVTRVAICLRCKNANRKLRRAGLPELRPPSRRGRARTFDPAIIDQLTQKSSGAFAFHSLNIRRAPYLSFVLGTVEGTWSPYGRFSRCRKEAAAAAGSRKAKR